MPAPASDDVDCPECSDAKASAEAKAAATTKEDGLQLRQCTPLYRAWAECVKEQKGQAKACAAVLDEFKACHKQLSPQ